MNGGRPSDVGRHRRRHRHGVAAVRAGTRRRGPRRWRAPSTSASAAPSGSSGSKDWAGLRAATARPAARAGAGPGRPATQVLPTSVPVPDDRRPCRSGRRRGIRARVEGDQQRGRRSLVGVGRGQRDAQAGVPGATVGGRMAGTSRPRSSSAAAAADGRAPRRRGRPGRSATGGRAGPGRRGAAAGRPGASPSAERTTRRAARAAAASAGVEAVVKMNGRARLTSRSTQRRRARRRSRRASRASWTACRPAATSRRRAPSGEVGAEHGVGLVEHQQRAVAAHTSARAVDGRRRRRPSRTRCR